MLKVLHVLVLPLGLMASTAYAKTVTVNIADFAFSATTLTLDIGDKVKWVNQDSFTHTSTSDTGVWDSGNLAKAQSFTQGFSKEGSYAYHCTIHAGMKASVTVRSPEQTKVQIGKDIINSSAKRLPIKLNLTGRKADQVYLGSYIVNTQGGCNDCHTCPSFATGRDPYKGEALQFNAKAYLAGGKAFGPFISANLTPDASGKPAGVTLAEFKDLMRTGKDPHEPDNILQVMPWPVYGLMSDRDLEAIYAYLSSIPKATQPDASACP